MLCRRVLGRAGQSCTGERNQPLASPPKLHLSEGIAIDVGNGPVVIQQAAPVHHFVIKCQCLPAGPGMRCIPFMIEFDSVLFNQ